MGDRLEIWLVAPYYSQAKGLKGIKLTTPLEGEEGLVEKVKAHIPQSKDTGRKGKPAKPKINVVAKNYPSDTSAWGSHSVVTLELDGGRGRNLLYTTADKLGIKDQYRVVTNKMY